MPSPEVLSRNLRQTSDRLRALLDTFTPAAEPAWASQQITHLLAELRIAGGYLREGIPQAGNSPDLTTEIASYWSHLERLRDVLPLIRCQLLAERARLAAQQEKVEATANWAQASKQSL